MTQIVKRKGHKENFDQRKIYASVYASLMSLRIADQEAELVADTVTKEVVEIFKDKYEFTAHSIHRAVCGCLDKYNPDAAYMYDTHRDIS